MTHAIPSPLQTLMPQPADALLSLIALHRADPRADKIDVGVGVYRDVEGRTPVMRAVKAAERRLLEEQATKSYLGAEGDQGFVARLAPLVFGSDLAGQGSLVGVQTPGGSGALRLGAELYAIAQRSARAWVGTPTWPNHAPILDRAGFRVEPHPFYDLASGLMDFDGMLRALDNAAPHDLLLLHGCCHNPTGLQFSVEQWDAITDLCLARRVVPFLDLAYQGLGEGWDEDADGVRRLIARVPTALIAYSCDKNFGLYRDRLGTLWLHEQSATARETAWQNILVLARSLWSMPPDHGAAVVRLILEDEPLAEDWRAELDGMRDRLNGIRRLLADADPLLTAVVAQRGMFGLLPISPEDVQTLRCEHAIYMAGSGRINIAGLTPDTIDRFAAAVVPYLSHAPGRRGD